MQTVGGARDSMGIRAPSRFLAPGPRIRRPFRAGSCSASAVPRSMPCSIRSADGSRERGVDSLLLVVLVSDTDQVRHTCDLRWWLSEVSAGRAGTARHLAIRRHGRLGRPHGWVSPA